MSKARVLAVSDLHLGYELSSINSPTRQTHFAEFLADLCSGECDRLILNGDCFEGCIPGAAGSYDALGFPPTLATISRNFFKILTNKLRVESLIWIPGNHDFTLWQKVATACNVGTFTNNQASNLLLKHDDAILQHADSFLTDFFGAAAYSFKRISAAYPNYTIGRYYPYITFHHGHFLDDLILGLHPTMDYGALALACGSSRPHVDVANDETIFSIHQKTEKFVESLWRFNSRAREIEWALLRRGQVAATCPTFGFTTPVQNETINPTLLKYATWYAKTLLTDPTTPAPLGPRNNPCFLVVGHDHEGGRANIPNLYDGACFDLINLGGWTKEGGTTKLHQHVMAWPYSSDTPDVFCFSG